MSKNNIPNTFIIGVQKAATTSLHHWIAQHPDVYGPNTYKDVDYFCNPEISQHAKERLIEDFSGGKEESVILQTYVNYALYKESISRIKNLVPEAKIIIIIRNPVDRAISAYKYFKKMGRENRSISEAFDYELSKNLSYSQDNNDFTYLEHGMYGEQIENVYSFFDTSKVLVLEFGELKQEPRKVCENVFKFLEIDTSFAPVFDKKNQTGSLKFKWLQKKLTTTNRGRKLILKYAVNWWLSAKTKKEIKKFLFEFNTHKTNETVEIPDALRNKLAAIFSKDQEKLETILNEQ